MIGSSLTIKRTKRFGSGLLLVAFLVVASAAVVARGPYSFSGGPGGVGPLPPNQPQPPAFAPANTFQTTLVVTVTGAAPSYMVIVTDAGGGSCAGTTNAHGFVVLTVPVRGDLELTVVGTSVVGVPVQGGQLVSILVD